MNWNNEKKEHKKYQQRNDFVCWWNCVGINDRIRLSLCTEFNTIRFFRRKKECKIFPILFSGHFFHFDIWIILYFIAFHCAHSAIWNSNVRGFKKKEQCNFVWVRRWRDNEIIDDINIHLMRVLFESQRTWFEEF